MMERITAKQEQIFKFLRAFTEEKGYPPSVREICQGIGLKSPSTVHAHLKALESAGYIKRDPNKTRAMLINETESSGVHAVSVPLLGQVAAGNPLLAVEDIEGYVPFDPGTSEREYFALRVKGDSMIDAGILEGDILIVEIRESAVNGEIVVALIDGEATVKRFKRTSDGVWLMPENSAYEPIDGRYAHIAGKVVASMRKY